MGRLSSYVCTQLVLFLVLGTITASVSSSRSSQQQTMSGDQNKPANLTAITWDHAVNSQALLTRALESDVQFIEADIILGSLFDDATHAQQPVMGHPPNTESDITLQSFLSQVMTYNRQHANSTKGVKLDFKSIEVFRGSEAMLQTMWPLMDYPVWINADIISGPVNNTETTPVQPRGFFDGVQQLPGAVLSIGWTTLWSKDHREGNYTAAQVASMVEAIKVNNITATGHEITFPVRAGIAANSLTAIHDLLGAVNATNRCTLTIWSSPDDHVNIDALRKLIFSVGLDKVYVDVPEEVSAQLDLGNVPAGASGLVHFGVVTAAMVLISVLFS